MKSPLLLPVIFVLIVFSGAVFLVGQKQEFIINNPAEPQYGEIAFDLEEDLVLGNESDENYLFYRVWDIQADARGNIYVLDSGATRIQKYDKNGKYLQTIGRQGQGPGEFQRPIILIVDKDQSVQTTR